MTISTTSKSDYKKPLLSKKHRQWIGNGFTYLGMTLLAFIFMIPIFWMFSTSLKSRWEIFIWPPQWIPETPHWENYVEVFTRYPMGRFMLNSGFLVIINIIGEFISVPLIAYGFARLRFPGKNFLFMVMLGTMMIPGHVKLIPLFTIYNRLGLLDTYWPLILPAFFGNPFFIFLMTQYIRTIPRDLDEAARMDGAGTWTILYKIIMPLCKPPLTIILVYTFWWTWNEFLHPLIYLNDFDSFPVQLGLAFFKGRYSVEWNLFMAATLVSIIPILILYFFLQKHLIGGIASVGIKG
ncbi:MAG: carbohydrate ABC transporter permease [Chloroflexi bacterium]|nr:MAG: carbohydrate ABC transporter permease [Chloroflexota bacterium]